MSTTVAGVNSGQGWSPLTQMQNQLQGAVSNGTVKAGDQDALSAALTDISTQLQSGAAGSTGTPAPGSMKSTVDGIISSDVSSGKLTSDQADELKSVLSQAAQKMHGHGGHHHVHGGGGDSDPDSDDSTIDPITGAPTTTPTSFSSFIQQLETALSDSISGVTGSSLTTDATASASATTSTSASSSSTSTQASNDPRQLMLSFLQKLESSLGGGNTYGATGTSGSTNTQAVLVNAFA